MAIFSLVLIPLFLFIALAVGALLLRAAVSLANKVLGPAAPPAMPESGLPIGPDGFTPQTSKENPFAIQTQITTAPSAPDSNPYATPAAAAIGAIPSAPRTNNAIQEPSFGKALGIMFLSGFASGVLSSVIGVLSSEVGIYPTLAVSLNLVIGILITISIYAGMLSTSFGKAALVYLFYILIAITVAAGVFAVVIAVQAATGSF